MAKPLIYDNIAISVEGTLLTDVSKISIEYHDSNQPILLLGGTMAVAPSTKLMTISIVDHVPVGKPDHSLLTEYLDTRRIGVAIQQMGNGKQLATTGFVKAPGFDAGVGQVMSASYAFICNSADWF